VPDETQKYRATRPVIAAGGPVQAGEEVALSAEDAAELLATGQVEAIPEPAVAEESAK